jgi:hypothetical protein
VALTRSATQLFTVAQSAMAVARAIVIAPLPDPLPPGDPLPVAALVTGPIARLRFALRDASGAEIQPARVAEVVAGAAAAEFAPLPAGGGYRLRVTDADDPTLGALSPPFAVADASALLLETGDGTLLAEQGGALLA